MLGTECPVGSVLLYQLGNFYEILDECADWATKKVPLRLSATGLAGFPVHRVDYWVPMFLASNLPVVIADQKELLDADGFATDIIDRAISRVVTPGTVAGEWLEDPSLINHLVAVSPADTTDGSCATAWTDVNTGKIFVAESNQLSLVDDLARINPVEVLVASPQTACIPSMLSLGDRRGNTTTPRDQLAAHGLETSSAALEGYYCTAVPEDWACGEPDSLLARFCGDLGPEVDGEAFSQCQKRAISMLLRYLSFCFRDTPPALSRPRLFESHGYMVVPNQVRKSLELTVCQTTGRRRDSLFGVVDRTVTSIGRRELQHRIQCPLLNVDQINRRLDLVDFFHSHRIQADVRKWLGPCRSNLSAISQGLLSGTASVESMLEQLHRLRAVLTSVDYVHALLHRECEHLTDARLAGHEHAAALLHSIAPFVSEKLSALFARLSHALPEDAEDPALLAPGFSPGYDEARAARGAVDDKIHALTSRYIAEIGQAHPRFSKSDSKRKFMVTADPAHGMVITTTKAFEKLLEEHEDLTASAHMSKSLRQFTSPELKKLATRHQKLSAKMSDTLSRALVDLTADFSASSRDYEAALDALAGLDVAMGLATVAAEKGYCRPVVDASQRFDVVHGRHAVVEDVQQRQFIANDCHLTEERTWILTGANMGGKSTFLRQNALLVVMAQMGSFVPADSAHIGVVDRIFTRIGASDHLAGDMSTFMVEMTEISQTLNDATERSLVVLDEVGRGTGYMDGVALASAIIRHLHVQIGCRTLSATHFLPLPALCAKLEGVAAYQLDITYNNEGIEFYHKVVPGVASGSHGVAVARLAGNPEAVLLHAHHLNELLLPSVAGILAPDAARHLGAVQDAVAAGPIPAGAN